MYDCHRTSYKIINVLPVRADRRHQFAPTLEISHSLHEIWKKTGFHSLSAASEKRSRFTFQDLVTLGVFSKFFTSRFYTLQVINICLKQVGNSYCLVFKKRLPVPFLSEITYWREIFSGCWVNNDVRFHKLKNVNFYNNCSKSNKVGVPEVLESTWRILVKKA